MFKNQKQEKWTSLTFILENTGEFNIEYNYEDISEQDSYEQRIIWKYKHLGIETKGERPQAIIQKHITESGKS